MDSSKIDRINELYHKSQSVGLTEEEKTEQAALKKEYLAAIRANLRSSLNNISIKEMVLLQTWAKNMVASRKHKQYKKIREYIYSQKERWL